MKCEITSHFVLSSFLFHSAFGSLSSCSSDAICSFPAVIKDTHHPLGCLFATGRRGVFLDSVSAAETGLYSQGNLPDVIGIFRTFSVLKDR